MKLTGHAASLIIFLLIIFGTFTSAAADVSKLIGTLTEQLGVTENQAKGGSGAIFDYAKQNLNMEDFSKVTDALPGVDSLIDSAPESSGLAGKMGSSLSSLGGKSSSLGGLGKLTDSFAKLGLKQDMINQFVPIILDFAKSEGGESVMNILKGALL